MSIDATTSTISVSSTGSSSNVSAIAAKSNSDTSFKEEMTNVSKSEGKKESKEVKNSNDSKSHQSKDEGKVSTKKQNSEIRNKETDAQEFSINPQGLFNPQFSMQDANMMLTNGIAQMIENTSSIGSIKNSSWMISKDSENKNNLSINEGDAQFFLELTKNNDVSMNGITAQAQNLINNGAEISEVRQNVQVSQTLLNALSDARQNNQPIRIDFDQNISVIIRVAKDGAISANFIPSDKVAEQYLRQNIDQLRSSFDEQNLPYTELSYSNSSKEQNRRRREQNRQGE